MFFSLFLAALTSSCTGAVDSDQIRKGNSKAPEKYQISEKCESASGEDCDVVISYPASSKEEK